MYVTVREMKDKGTDRETGRQTGRDRMHWKEIMAMSFLMHFFFDWIVLAVGILIGMHIGHSHG